MKRTPVTRTGKGQASRASPYDRLLQAAKSLFARKGYENASTAAIARLAGTSESQMMKYFGSKEGLLEAIFNQAWQQIAWNVRQAVQELASPREKLNALIERTLTAIEKDPNLKLLTLLEGRRMGKDGQMVLLHQGYLEFVRLAENALREMRNAGELRSDLHVEGLRSALMGALEGLLRDQLLAQRVGYPARYNSKELRKIFDEVLASFTAQRPASGSKTSRF